jgi:hypothetical protein
VGQDLNAVLDTEGQSVSWSGPPGAFVSSVGGAAAGDTFVRLLNGANPTEHGWLAMEITGPAWVDFQFRPFDGTVSTSTAGFELWPYRENSIAGARWNAGSVFLPPGPNRLEWSGYLFGGLLGPMIVDLDDVHVRRTEEVSLVAALNGNTARVWRTSPEAPWTGLATAPSPWFLPGVLEVRPSCAWTRVTPERPSTWIETTFAGPGRLSALSAVVPWQENWIFPFGTLVTTLDEEPIAVWRHSLSDQALDSVLIPPGQHVVRWTLDRQDVPDLPNQVADAQLSRVIYEPRQEVSLDVGLGSTGWRTSPKNPWFALQEEAGGAISGALPGTEPTWIEKTFDGPSVLTFGVARANASTVDAPRELLLNLDGQDLPTTAPNRYSNPGTDTAHSGIVPGGYSLVLPDRHHTVRWTSTTTGGLITMKNVAATNKPMPWLAEALGVPGAVILTANHWTESAGGWQPVADGYRGAPAVRSGNVSIDTWMQIWVDGPAIVSFWSRAEGDHDSSTSFQVDGMAVRPSGAYPYASSADWQQTRLILERGRHQLRWSAIYDGAGTGYYVSRLKISPPRNFQWRKIGVTPSQRKR